MTKLKWHTEQRRVGDLIPFEHNPRQITDEQAKQLKKSLERFDLVEIPAVDLDNTIVAGHQRLKMMQLLGRTEEVIDVRVPNRKLTEKEFKEYNLRSNKNTGEWNFDILANNFDTDLLLDVGFEDMDFDLGGANKEIIEDETPAMEEGEPIAKPGDIYQLGRHRIMCGDSTNPLHVESLLQKQKIILMITDPPYGVNYDPEWRDGYDLGVGKRSKGKVANDDIVDWSPVFCLYDCQVLYVWHAAKFASEVAQSLINCGYGIISQIIWAKQHFVLSRGDYHWQHEPCWYVVKNNMQHNWQGARDQSTIWNIKNNNSFGNAQKEETVGHGTQKPVECMARPILNNSKKNDIICDPFLGSGSTVIACEQTNRICYGMEIEPRYIDVIIARWEKFTGEKAKKIE